MRFARLPGVRRAPMRMGPVQEDLVLFDSWSGRYTDNPRAISEAMHRRGIPLRQCWVLDEGREGPDWADRVTPGSWQHLNLLGRAGYIFTNNTLPGFFRKRPGTTLVQTWHGTPLKRIAFDLPRDGTRHQTRYLEHLDREVKQWDYLVSPNPPSTKWLRQAFRFGGDVLETGYPRNDVLARADDGGGERRRIREQLGVPADARVVLYAPTFRRWGQLELHLDADGLADALGPDAHVLVRHHHLSAPADGAYRHPRVHDMTARPDDPALLFTIADALITDYSSVMFDFAITGRPIVFFAYDLAHYRDELRGFYFDFESEAPGPIVTSNQEVVDALSDPDRLAAQWRERYEAFQRRFCSLEDGGAADRVVDAVLRTRNGHGSTAAVSRSA